MSLQQKRKAPDEADVAGTAPIGPAPWPKRSPEPGLFSNCRTFLLPVTTPDRPAVAEKITSNGGRVTDERRKDVLVLMNENVPAKSDTFKNDRCLIRLSWLWQCLERNELLPTRNFGLQGSLVEPLPAEEGDVEETVEEVETPVACPGLAQHPRPEGGRSGGRMHFTEAEDEALRKWVLTHRDLPEMGKKIWEQAERARITRHGWASMQNRWRRHAKHRAPPPRLEHVRALGGSSAPAAAAAAASTAASTAAPSSSSGGAAAAAAPALASLLRPATKNEATVAASAAAMAQSRSERGLTTTSSSASTGPAPVAYKGSSASSSSSAPAAFLTSLPAAASSSASTSAPAGSAGHKAASTTTGAHSAPAPQVAQPRPQQRRGNPKNSPSPQHFTFASFIGGKSKQQLQEEGHLQQQQQQQQQQQPQQQPQQQQPAAQPHQQASSSRTPEVTVYSSSQEYFTPDGAWEEEEEEEQQDQQAGPCSDEADPLPEETWEDLLKTVLDSAPSWIRASTSTRASLDLL